MYLCNNKQYKLCTNKLILFIIIFTLSTSLMFSSYTTSLADTFQHNSTNKTLKHHSSIYQLTKNECENNVLQSLKKINDPELNINIVDLGLIKEIKCNNISKTLSVTIILTSPFCPYIKNIVEEIRKTASETATDKKTTVIIDTKTRWNPSRMTKEGRKHLWGGE